MQNKTLTVALAAAILIATTGTALSQGPRDIVYDGTKGDSAQLMPLVTHVKVRREIDLSTQQWKDLQPHLKRWKESFKPDKPDEFRDQSEWIKVLDEVLLRHQMERLQQIHWRAMGIHVIGSPEFAKRLKITKKQASDFDQLRKYLAKESAKVSALPDGSKERMTRKADMLKNIQSRVKEMFDEEQTTQFAKLLGKPFDLTGISRPNY